MIGYDVTSSVKIAQNQSTSIENPNGGKVKEKLATNVSQKLNEKGNVSFIKNLFKPNKKIALTSFCYKEKNRTGMAPTVQCLWKLSLGQLMFP